MTAFPRIRVILVALGIALAPGIASAQTTPATATDTIRGLFGTTPATLPGSFADAFLAQVPYSAVRAGANDLTARLGPIGSVTGSGSEYALAFERGSALASIKFDPAGKIVGLLFHDEESPADQAAITKFLTVPKIDASLFAPAARGLVNADNLEAVRTQLAGGGKFVDVLATPDGYLARFEHTESHVTVSTDSDGLITLIFFKPPTKRSS